MTNNTIFDDVFRTMVEKMTYLVVPLINEVFHTAYPEDVKIVQLCNEHQLEDGEIITDSCLRIGDMLYHIECQSLDDETMAVRMVEYDFAIALEHRKKVDGRYCVEFPRSCVLYLRNGKRTPDFLEVELILPFYIMRYEKVADIIEKDSEKLQRLLSEYEDIRNKLGKEISISGRAELYTDLNRLIIRISDYVFRNKEKVRKGVGEVMGGKVLQLESERLREEGMAIGKAEGKAEGEARLSALINRLFLEGRSDEVQRVVTDVKWRQKLYGEYNL